MLPKGNVSNEFGGLMVPVKGFFKIVEDEQQKLWCISSLVQMKPGYNFVIVCKNFGEAKQIVYRIVQGHLNIPTVNPYGFDEIPCDAIFDTRFFKPR